MNPVYETTMAMIAYDAGVPSRIHHFLKVHDFAKTIAVGEGLDADMLLTIELAALVHDIGIKVSLAKYGSSAGHYQEIEGPAEAAALLKNCGVEDERSARIQYLVGHHHTYTDIDGIDYQILIEADFLVNIHEGNAGADETQRVYDKLMKTKTGREIYKAMFL